MNRTADPARRQQAWRRGWRAETLAAWWLRLKGYRILERRLRTPAGELDLVARRGRMLVFVEVKARDAASAAMEAVTPRQQQRIARAAQQFVAARPRHRNDTIRFDVVVIAKGRPPHHIVDAWRPESW